MFSMLLKSQSKTYPRFLLRFIIEQFTTHYTDIMGLHHLGSTLQ